MKTLLIISTLLFFGMIAGACGTMINAMAPVNNTAGVDMDGRIFSSTRSSPTVPSEIGSKVSEVCQNNVLGLVSWGSLDIEEAAKAQSMTKITSVSYSRLWVLNPAPFAPPVFMRRCAHVSGS